LRGIAIHGSPPWDSDPVEILATYAYAEALPDGLDDDEATRRGMVAAEPLNPGLGDVILG
jgi:hypothetical protein